MRENYYNSWCTLKIWGMNSKRERTASIFRKKRKDNSYGHLSLLENNPKNSLIWFISLHIEFLPLRANRKVFKESLRVCLKSKKQNFSRSSWREFISLLKKMFVGFYLRKAQQKTFEEKDCQENFKQNIWRSSRREFISVLNAHSVSPF